MLLAQLVHRLRNTPKGGHWSTQQGCVLTIPFTCITLVGCYDEIGTLEPVADNAWTPSVQL